MFALRVSCTDFQHRLDCWFYNPRALEATKVLSSRLTVERLAVLVDPTRSITNGVRGPDWQDSIFKLIRLQDCKDWIVDTENAASISFQQFEEHRRCKLEVNDIVVAIGGYVGNASVLTEPARAVIGQHSAILPSFHGGPVDSRFLLAYLNSKFAEEIFQRFVSGTVQPGVNLEDLRDIPAPVPEKLSQLYIGDKVRQAERLRFRAKWLEKGFEAKLQEKLSEAFDDRRTGRKHSTAMKQEISYTLNPGAFDEERLRIQRYLKMHGGKPLKDVATITGVATASYEDEMRYVGLDAISSNSCQLRPVTVASAGVIGSCRLLNEGPVVAKLRPYLNKVSYIPSWLSGAVGSTELLCVKAKGDLSNWYLYGVLKSEATLKQLRPLASGATHPRIDKYDLYHIVIPVLPAANEMGAMLAQAQAAYFISGFLTTAARLLIESLIEGQITEAQLIAAQQALEAGDDSLDRAILARIKTDRLDGAGEPLFPDLDQLYDLLESAQPEAGA